MKRLIQRETESSFTPDKAHPLAHEADPLLRPTDFDTFFVKTLRYQHVDFCLGHYFFFP